MMISKAGRNKLLLRRGFTIFELLVTMTIIIMIFTAATVSVSNIFDLRQHTAVKELSHTYIWLLQESALRNTAFRIAINLDRGSYKIEVGDAGALVFSSPEDAEEYQEQQREKMRRFTRTEIEEGAMEDEESLPTFQTLEDVRFQSEKPLPDGLKFSFVYTPRYGEDGLTPHDDLPNDPEEERIAYTHIFPDGTAEHAVIRITDIDDEDDGYTLEVEPVSGRVHLSREIIHPSDSLSWLPAEGPRLQ